MSDTLGLNEHGAISTCLLPFSFGNNEIYRERGGDIYLFFFSSSHYFIHLHPPRGIRFLVYVVHMHVFLRIFITSGGSSLK